MAKKTNNIGGLLAGLEKKNKVESEAGNAMDTKVAKSIANPAIELATGDSVKRAISIKEPVLQLKHDQVVLFKYHDRDASSLDSIKVTQIKRSIESEGQHFPGIVRKTSDTTEDGRMIYELIVGRLRYEASRGVGVFKAFLKDIDDSEAAKLMFSENEDRQDIGPFERWLSILPILEDRILSISEIAKLINWDQGNLSRTLKAKKVYVECELHKYLTDVSKVKLNPLIELAKVYEEKPEAVKSAIQFIVENYEGRRDTLFLKSILKHMKEIVTSQTEKVILSGCQVTLKKTGDNLTITCKGLPKQSEFKKIISELDKLDALR